MKAVEYYLEKAPRPWNGMQQLHAAGCSLMPGRDEVKLIGRFERSVIAMTQARRLCRRAHGCHHCCKA